MTLATVREPSIGELDVARAWIDLLAPAVELAKVVAGTDFVPKALRNNPAAVAAAILYGDEVGLGPLAALSLVAVVDGRPTMLAEAQRGLILAAGHDIWPEEMSSTAVTWAGRRRGADVTTRVTWTLDDARRAGLAGRPAWRAYPRQMLSARASAELARAIFSDVTRGLAATEELGEAPDPLALAAPETATETPTRRRRNRKTAPTPAIATTTAPAEPPVEPPLPGEEGQPGMDPAQRKRIMALFRARGLASGPDRKARLDYASGIIGRDLGTTSDLNADEAAKVIAALEADAAEAGDEPSPATPKAGDTSAEGEAGPSIPSADPDRLPEPSLPLLPGEA
jgi:hypothetical protein